MHEMLRQQKDRNLGFQDTFFIERGQERFLMNIRKQKSVRKRDLTKNTSNKRTFFSHYSKAQISMEILSYYIILAGVFLVTLVLIVNNQNAINEEKTILDARNTLVFVKN